MPKRRREVNLTYADLADELDEARLCINRLSEAARAFRYGWSNDEDPFGPLSCARRELGEEMESIIGAHR